MDRLFRFSRPTKGCERKVGCRLCFNWTTDVAPHDWGNEEPQGHKWYHVRGTVDGVEKALRVGDLASRD
jgi:hypothetical protein